ncbi:MAG: T9SS type A sorting domain-containing protein [Bacteroidetes bacterium]|nr:T9SS type A sorting domain-containing protein [Bacteroidota bacterium]
MKKTYILFLLILLSSVSFSQIAPNFTVNDCNASSVDLYTQLNSGKVVIICWVMPCSSCIPASKTTYNVAQSYQTSNPNKVLFYLCDDYGDTPCASIDSWANANTIPASATSLRFSNAAINMTNYGSAGMPKIIVVGGASHTIFYSANGTVDPTALQTGINNAILAANSVNEIQDAAIAASLFPNPVSNLLNITFQLEKQSNVTIEIYNNLGAKILAKSEKCSQGNNKIEVNTKEFNKGIYYAKISNGNTSKTLKFNLVH